MIELTDENFEKEIQSAKQPVLVDFWTEWCSPCLILTPILESLAEQFQGKIIFSKVNIDSAPLTAQKYQIEQIPKVILFKNGQPASGFLGLRPRELIEQWLIKEQLIQESADHAQAKGWQLNPNREIVNRTVEGLLKNEKEHGFRYCPCRRVSGDEQTDQEKICPCPAAVKDVEEKGSCLCQLFVKKQGA